MTALNIFTLPKFNLKVSFSPDDHFISLGPKTQQNKHIFADVLNHLQTVLQTFDLKSTPTSASMKVGDNVDLSVLQGVLRSKGFSGGESVEDSASVAEKNLPAQTEALNYSLKVLFESTYRSAPYWQDIFQYSGKNNKSLIEADDVLRMRKMFTKKPESRTRDKVLRALDKAARYFTKKIRRSMGPAPAEDFKEKYKNIGSLLPSDYAEDKGGHQAPEQPQEPGEQLNLSSFFGDSDDNKSYDDIEIERI